MSRGVEQLAGARDRRPERYDARRATAGDVTIEARYWFNPDIRSQNFLIPGSIAIIMTLIGTLLDGARRRAANGSAARSRP